MSTKTARRNTAKHRPVCCAIWELLMRRLRQPTAYGQRNRIWKIFREKGVTVASCPVSNLKLASGVCDVPALLKKGVRVAHRHRTVSPAITV